MGLPASASVPLAHKRRPNEIPCGLCCTVGKERARQEVWGEGNNNRMVVARRIVHS